VLGRISAPIALAACLLAGGCGGGTKTVIVSTPPTETAATTTRSSPASPANAGIVHRGAFRSPSGNIGCAIAGAAARCDIVHRSWSPPSRPASCPPVVDFGQGLMVQRGAAAQIVCAGDTARDPSSPVLAYGSSSEAEGFTCASRITGMTCTDSSTGHGFFISAQSYRLF
jgi:hypothetical protein